MERSGVSVDYAVWFELLFYHEEHEAHEGLDGFRAHIFSFRL
jgi:hypothetical protein